MYLELFSYVEGDESLELAENLGYVTLEEDDVYIDVDNDELAEELEEFFSEPITVASNGLSGEKEIEPYTVEFFRMAPQFLEDLKIRARVKEDEESAEFVKKTIVNEEELDELEEGEDELPLDMTLEDMGELDSDYTLGADSIGEPEEIDTDEEFEEDEPEEEEDEEED